MNLPVRLKRFIEKLEGLRISPLTWTLIFLLIVFARNFLEQFGPEKIVFNFPSFFLHFPLAYAAPVLALSALLSLLARERIENVTRAMLFAWFLTLLPPLVDLLTGKMGDNRIAYLYVDRGTILPTLANFFNPAYKLEGTTPGIRIEAFLGCVLASAYVFLKTGRVSRTVLTFFVTYFSFLFFFTLPYTFVMAAGAISPGLESIGSLYFEAGLFLKSHTDRVAYSIALLDLLLVFVFLAIWLRLFSRSLFMWVARRFARFGSVHYGLSVLFGILLAAKSLGMGQDPKSMHVYDVLAGLSLVLSALCGFWSASSLAGWSEWDRPQRFSAGVMLVFSLLFAGMVGYAPFALAITFAAFIALYYVRPLSLHMYFPASTVTVGLATVSCVLMGFSTAAGVLVPRVFPRDILLAILSSCVLGFVAKDYVGGARRGRLLAAGGVVLGFLSPGVILRSGFLAWSGLILGAAAAASLVIRLRSRPLLVALYSVFACIAGVMTLAERLPVTRSTRVDRDEMLHLARAEEFQIGHMYEEAVIEFEKAVSAGADDASVFFALGFANQEIGDLNQSAYWYRKAVLEDTERVEAYNNLGSVLIGLGQTDSAVAVLKSGLEKDPRSGRLLRNLFLALFDSGRHDELVRMLVPYVEANPADYRSRELLADTYIRVDDLGAAETEYRKVLGARRGYVPAIVGLGYIMANRGDIEEAEKHFLVALELDPQNVDAMHRLGYILLEKGDTAGAIGFFREIIKLEPLVPNHYDSLGDAYMKAGLYEEARKAYEMAVALDSTSSHAREMLEKLTNP